EVAVGLLGILEDDDVAAADGTDGEDGAPDRERRRPEDELVDQQVIADQQVVLHRAGRDLERLHDPSMDEQREDHRNDDRLEVLAEDRFLVGWCCHVQTPDLKVGLAGGYSCPTLRTARNASCGISTRPTRFMRFLPSFCFSSSLRFRVM